MKQFVLKIKSINGEEVYKQSISRKISMNMQTGTQAAVDVVEPVRKVVAKKEEAWIDEARRLFQQTTPGPNLTVDTETNMWGGWTWQDEVAERLVTTTTHIQIPNPRRRT